MTIVTINKVNADHLEMVKAEMATLGAPIIRAVHFGEGVYVALEGSHRIVAAAELGLEPIIDEIEYSDEMITIQWDGGEEEFMISELADSIYAGANRNSEIVDF